jgi:tetratricopeptide (TPR) repeat protein
MERIRILIVSEKSYEIRQIREQIELLPFDEHEKSNGLEIYEEASAKSAFELVESNLGSNTTFDLIFASEKMQYYTGLQLAQKILGLEVETDVPFVVFSGDIANDIKSDLLHHHKNKIDSVIMFFELPATFDELKKLMTKLAEKLISVEDKKRANAIESLMSYRDTTDFLTTMENIYMRSAREVSNIKMYAPWSSGPYLSLGRIYVGCNMFETAIPYLKKALNIDFSLKEAHKNLAICYRKTDQSFEELEELKELLTANPKSSSILFRVGDAYLRDSDYKKAAAFFEKAIANHGGNDTVRMKAKSHVGLGKAYLDEGDDTKDPSKYDMAEGEFKTAIKVDPTLVAAYNNLFITYKKLGREKEAKEIMQKALKIMPDDAEGWLELFEIYLSDGDQQKAKFSLGKALKYDPENQKILCSAGEAYIRQKMLNEAIELFEKAVLINPSDLRLYNYLGICCRRLDDTKRAVLFYMKALRINPNDPNIHYNIAKAYHQGNELELAEKSYNNALKLNAEFSEAENALKMLIKYPNRSEGRKGIR